MTCELKAGNDLLPAAPGVVYVDNNVAVASNVEDVEYQHFRSVISALTYVPAVVTVKPLSVADADVTTRL